MLMGSDEQQGVREEEVFIGRERDEEEEEEEEGYREMESGLDASFLWSRDKSEKRRKGKRERMQNHKRGRRVSVVSG